MAKFRDYEAYAETLAKPIADSLGLAIVDVEYVKEAGENYLRIYIDKEGGVTIDDCEALSRPLSDALDREDRISEGYILEVSSPGLGRALKKEKDYVRNTGKPVEIRLFRPIDGRKEYVGDLRSFDEEKLTIVTDGQELAIERKNISLIKEYVNWDEF